MPILIALSGVLIQITSTLLGRVLLSLGFGMVSYTGFSILLDSIIAGLKGSFGGMSAVMLNFVAWMWVDKALSIIIAAVNTSLSIQLAGAAGGALRKWVVTRPTLL